MRLILHDEVDQKQREAGFYLRGTVDYQAVGARVRVFEYSPTNDRLAAYFEAWFKGQVG